MKDLADEQSGFYRDIGVLLRPATGTGLGRVPCGKRLFGEPDRDIATLAQSFVIFGPVGHFVTRFLDLVTAALVVFVRHRLFRRGTHRGSCQIARPRAGRSIYSTTPLTDMKGVLAEMTDKNRAPRCER